MKRLIILLVICTTSSIFSKSPIPDNLLNAKTAYLINDGTWIKLYDKFYDEFVKWNRFEIVQDSEKADIIITLSTKASEDMLIVPLATGGVIGGSSSRFYLRIVDGKTKTPLWADSTGETMLVSNSAKKMVKRLRQRMEEK